MTRMLQQETICFAGDCFGAGNRPGVHRRGGCLRSKFMELFHELMCFQRTIVFLKIILYYTVTFILTFEIHF